MSHLICPKYYIFCISISQITLTFSFKKTFIFSLLKSVKFFFNFTVLLLGEGTNTWWILFHSERKSRHRRIKKQHCYECLANPEESCSKVRQGWVGQKWDVWDSWQFLPSLWNIRVTFKLKSIISTKVLLLIDK